MYRISILLQGKLRWVTLVNSYTTSSHVLSNVDRPSKCSLVDRSSGTVCCLIVLKGDIAGTTVSTRANTEKL